MKEPVDHILRPLLPWRSGPAITECGYNAEKVQTITRAQFDERVKEMGQQRAAMFTCMTCADTSRRHGTWDEDPRLALRREIDWERPGYRYHEDRNGYRLRDELLAIAAIVAEHRAVFDAMVAEAQRRREWLEKKADHEKAKEQKTVLQLKPRL